MHAADNLGKTLFCLFTKVTVSWDWGLVAPRITAGCWCCASARWVLLKMPTNQPSWAHRLISSSVASCWSPSSAYRSGPCCRTGAGSSEAIIYDKICLSNA